MILADTSVWVSHFRSGLPKLEEALGEGHILGHPDVIGELACGNLKNRTEILRFLQRLPRATVVTDAEALAFVEEHRLQGRGIGWTDVRILASALLSRARLWTLDRALERVSTEIQPGGLPNTRRLG